MKLVRLYSNQRDKFEGMQFNDGLSVILAEIRVPANKGIDTHNLGKTTVGSLIDFCLLKGRSSEFFLYEHPELFHGFVFYLTVLTTDGRYITIARGVEDRGRISIHVSDLDVDDVSTLTAESWTHVGLPFSRAKHLLDGLLSLSALSPFAYRSLMGYLIRGQDDYSDVFQLRKLRGKHSTWKPFLAHLLGLDASLSTEIYAQIAESDKLKSKLAALESELGADAGADVTKLDGLLAIKKREIEAAEEAVNSFNFYEEDTHTMRELVDRTDLQISLLNEESYRIEQLLSRIEESLQQAEVQFRTDEAQQLFNEVGIAFGGQLKRDFDQLIEFSREITTERRAALIAEREELIIRRSEIGPVLLELQKERAESLSFLNELEAIDKYKTLSSRVVDMKAAALALESRREAITRVINLKQELRTRSERYGQLQTAVEKDVQSKAESDTSLYARIQRYFDEVIFAVIDEHALLTVKVNVNGGLEFSADLVNQKGDATSGGRGHTYKKLLCIAFDLALIRAYKDLPFCRFVFHDGVFETLDPRKKRNLVAVLRQYAALGLQPVITTLDEDLPDDIDSALSSLTREDVICALHDEGPEGRLFRMESW